MDNLDFVSILLMGICTMLLVGTLVLGVFLLYDYIKKSNKQERKEFMLYVAIIFGGITAFLICSYFVGNLIVKLF